MILTLLLAAGCAGKPRAVSPPPASSPAASSTPSPSSPAPDDAGLRACRDIKKIVDDGNKVTIRRLAEVGDEGAGSIDSHVARAARLLSDFASVAALQIQAGADPAEKAESLRAAIRDLVEACEASSYI
ncbi:hypothetical protein [Actinoplanes sp. NPDC026623]|uniref:hypothetical protein n=1 Tax=Actinoplanes sp. NPDC026623 TaxID=3155610 RepID=UPI0033D60B91